MPGLNFGARSNTDLGQPDQSQKSHDFGYFGGPGSYVDVFPVVPGRHQETERLPVEVVCRTLFLPFRYLEVSALITRVYQSLYDIPYTMYSIPYTVYRIRILRKYTFLRFKAYLTNFT